MDDKTVEAVAAGIRAEWKKMASELKCEHISWPVSPANYRLVRAAIAAYEAAREPVADALRVTKGDE